MILSFPPASQKEMNEEEGDVGCAGFWVSKGMSRVRLDEGQLAMIPVTMEAISISSSPGSKLFDVCVCVCRCVGVSQPLEDDDVRDGGHVSLMKRTTTNDRKNGPKDDRSRGETRDRLRNRR